MRIRNNQMCKIKTYLFFLVLLCNIHGLTSQVSPKADSLQRAANNQEGITKIYTLHHLFGAVMRSDIEKARGIIEETENIALELNSPKGQAIAWSMHCQIYKLSSQFDSLYTKANEGILLSERIGADTTLARFQLFLGIYHEKTGSLDSAIYWYNKSNEHDALDPIFTNNNLGLAHIKLGELEKGAEYLQLAIQAAQKNNSIAIEAIVSNNLGRVYSDFGDEKRAKKYYLRSIELKKQTGDERGTLFALANLTTLNSLPIAEINSYANEGYALAKKLNDPYFLTAFAPRKARVISRDGQYEEALDILRPIYNEYDGSKSADEYIEVLSALSEIYSRKGDLNSAERYAKEWVNASEKNNHLKSIQNGRKKLLQIYSDQADHKAYFELAPIYFAVEDSIRKAANIEKLAQLENQLRDVEQDKKIAELNVELQQKEKRRNLIILGSILIGMILLLIIYFRNRQLKTKQSLIEQEQKNAKELAIINEQLKSLDHMKSQFFTNISHELRTPVTLIATPLSHTLKRYSSVMQEKVKEAVVIAQKNAHKLGALVEELLELSKIEAGKATINLIPTHLNQYLQQLFSAYDSAAVIKQIIYIYDDQLPVETYALIDKKRLSKIVNNLLSNALKFTPNQGEITLKSVLTADHRLQVSVRDTGRGIPEEDLSKIFDRYYQVSSKHFSAEGGTGIGLSLANELAILMGGNLEAESVLAKGSTFTLELPLELIGKEKFAIQLPVAEAATVPSVISTTFSADPISGDHKNDQPRLLIVEDNVDMQQLLISLLSDNYDFVIANNGAEAWQLLSQKDESVKQISLIISDVMMPEMDGYTLLEKIKADDYWRHLPVIMLTARAAEEDKLRALRMGVDDYLAKPFSSDELFTRTENLIQRYEERKSFNKLGIQLDFESTPSADQEWLKSLEDICRNAMDKKLDITNSHLADQLVLSERQLQRRVKTLTGLSVKQYVQEIRLQKARHLLENKIYNTIAEVAYASGFNTPKYFSRVYQKHFGIRPIDYFSEIL